MAAILTGLTHDGGRHAASDERKFPKDERISFCFLLLFHLPVLGHAMAVTRLCRRTALHLHERSENTLAANIHDVPS